MVTSSEYQRDDGQKHVERFVSHYSIEQMKKLLEKAGFEIVTANMYKEDYGYNKEKAAYLPEKLVIFARKPKEAC